MHSVYLESDGFILRTLSPNDISPRVAGWFTSERMCRGLNMPVVEERGVDDVRNFPPTFDNIRGYLIGIYDGRHGPLIGFYVVEVAPSQQAARITFGIGEESYEGQRVSWRTIDVLLNFFFLEIGIQKVYAAVLSTNLRMLFNFIGNPRFIFKGRIDDACEGPEGDHLDTLIFVAHKPESVDDGASY